MAAKKKNEAAKAAQTKDAGVTAAPTQAREPVTQVSIPTQRSKMTKATAKDMGLDASVYGDIDAKPPAKKEAE